MILHFLISDEQINLVLALLGEAAPPVFGTLPDFGWHLAMPALGLGGLLHCTLPLEKAKYRDPCWSWEPKALGAQPSGVRDTQAGRHLGKEQRMILSGPTYIRLEGPFPDSTLWGNAELGDNNQIAVALVILMKELNFCGGLGWPLVVCIEKSFT